MKLNKYTTALIAAGLVAVSSAAQANTVIFLAGASALRSTIAAAISAGKIFDSGGTIVTYSSNSGGAGGAQYVVYRGVIGGVTYDIDAFWTGAEAAVADVAGNSISQTLNGSSGLSGGSGTYAVPGIPASFLDPATSYATTNTFASINSGYKTESTVDLALDDTSQAVSLTSHTTYPLVDYGALAVVPFSFLKGYEKTPDTVWNHVSNVTTAEINQLYKAPHPASFITGVSTDSVDYVYITGRNLSSGTRVNALLTAQYGVTTTVDQYAYDVNYNKAGNLAQNSPANYANTGTLYEIGNDGFNASGTAALQLNYDGTGTGNILVEPLAVPDAAGAAVTAVPSGGVAGAASYLTYNGVWESDANVENGSYTFWGYEHIFGTVGQSNTSAAGKVAAALVSGIGSYLTSISAGTSTGAVGPTYTAQSPLIPVSLLQVTRAGDGGFPAPKN